MVRTFLLFLLFLFFARAVLRLLGGIVKGVSGAAAPSRGHRAATPPAVKMVRDPVCGTYVVPGKALERARGRETLYFCSEKCRDQYFQKN